jgi:Putative lumazine-binding
MDFRVLAFAGVAPHNPFCSILCNTEKRNMKRLVLGLSLLLLTSLSITAQNQESPRDDAAAVRSTVTNYIEAYYTGDAARMEQTLHPHYLKQKIHGDIPVRQQTRADLVQSARSGEGTHLTQAERTEQVSVLDIADNIASAKLVTPGWTDYLTLTKMSGEWKILSVVQRFND